MKENRKKIREILVEAGLIDKIQLSAALGEQTMGWKTLLDNHKHGICR